MKKGMYEENNNGEQGPKEIKEEGEGVSIRLEEVVDGGR